MALNRMATQWHRVEGREKQWQGSEMYGIGCKARAWQWLVQQWQRCATMCNDVQRGAAMSNAMATTCRGKEWPR